MKFKTSLRVIYPHARLKAGRLPSLVGKITRVMDVTRVIYPREIHVTSTRRLGRILPRVNKQCPNREKERIRRDRISLSLLWVFIGRNNN